VATILLVEDEPDLGLFEAGQLEREGHRVMRCGGAPGVLGACPLLKYGACPLVEPADMILFSCRMFTPLRGRAYTGRDLLYAYRNHVTYGRLPMVVVSVGAPADLPGSGAVEIIDKFSEPGIVIRTIDRVLQAKNQQPAGVTG